MDLQSAYGNMDVMLRGDNSNSINSEMENATNDSVGHYDSEALPRPQRNSAQKNEIRQQIMEVIFLDTKDYKIIIV